jgi:hypothetical protein
MPLIYLKHPRHGAKIATMEMEADFDETNGWVRYNPNAPLPISEPEIEVPVNALNIKRKYTRKVATQGV